VEVAGPIALVAGGFVRCGPRRDTVPLQAHRFISISSIFCSFLDCEGKGK
jgi:hypothetical protein